jgi:hypothetical protein
VPFYKEVAMKDTSTLLHLPELKATFSERVSIAKNELRSFYRIRTQDFNEQFFRRVLYALEKEQILVPLGSGMYVFKEQEVNKRKFLHSPSKELSSIHQILQKTFPYLDYLCWETRILHEFTTHQPGQNIIVVEAEKEACESVFNRLMEKYTGRVFLDPTRSLMENYVLPQASPIIVLPLISESPRTTHNNIPFPKLEKILVDILVDENIFFAFQGAELSYIYENAFNTYWLNQRTMFRYARRRKAEKIYRNLYRLKQEYSSK